MFWLNIVFQRWSLNASTAVSYGSVVSVYMNDARSPYMNCEHLHNNHYFDIYFVLEISFHKGKNRRLTLVCIIGCIHLLVCKIRCSSEAIIGKKFEQLEKKNLLIRKFEIDFIRATFYCVWIYHFSFSRSFISVRLIWRERKEVEFWVVFINQVCDKWYQREENGYFEENVRH